jgi:trigger factor
MKVTVEDVSSVKKVLHFEIPEEKVVSELNDAYKDLKKTAKIKGFRPGKAPRSVLERMFKKDVHADVTSRLLQESFVEAIRENKLNIVGNPEIDPPELQTTGAYKYDATVEIPPEIDDFDFKGISLEKTLYAASDGEVDAQLSMLQKNLAEKKPITEERELKADDFALIDYEGFKDGQPFEETGKTENYTLKIGTGQITPDFDTALIGMKKGETREFAITFPDDYFNEKLRGLEISFTTTLNDILEEVLPEIDDELAKKLGQFQSLDELKAKILENLKSGYEKRSEQELNEQVFKALIEKTDFELPEAMVNIELEGILQEAQQSFAQHNIDMAQLGMTPESLKEKYRETAENQVRRHLLLNKLVEQESLELTDEDVENAFQEMADTYNQPVEGIKGFYAQNQEKLDLFKHTLLEKNALKLIIDNSDIKEVEPKAEAETQAPAEG